MASPFNCYSVITDIEYVSKHRSTTQTQLFQQAEPLSLLNTQACDWCNRKGFAMYEQRECYRHLLLVHRVEARFT